ncbi:MAG: ABC transporter permease subunit [Terracidiphilus sp.]
MNHIIRRSCSSAIFPGFSIAQAGALVFKTNFSRPGLGRLAVSAISDRDYALMQGCLLSIGFTYVLVNPVTDVVYRRINPRMKG